VIESKHTPRTASSKANLKTVQRRDTLLIYILSLCIGSVHLHVENSDLKSQYFKSRYLIQYSLELIQLFIHFAALEQASLVLGVLRSALLSTTATHYERCRVRAQEARVPA
jgi:hypothetical protein